MNAFSVSLFVFLNLILSLCLGAQSRIVTLEGEIIDGNLKGISAKGVVSLDEKNEQLILENISKYKGLQTIFFATHKLDILKYFEKVLFIKDGKIEKVLDQNKSN